MASLAEQHAAAQESPGRWAGEAARARKEGHPDRPAVFYEHFEDGSFVQATVELDGAVRIEPGVSYDDAKAQSGELYEQRAPVPQESVTADLGPDEPLESGGAIP